MFPTPIIPGQWIGTSKLKICNGWYVPQQFFEPSHWISPPQGQGWPNYRVCTNESIQSSLTRYSTSIYCVEGYFCSVLFFGGVSQNFTPAIYFAHSWICPILHSQTVNRGERVEIKTGEIYPCEHSTFIADILQQSYPALYRTKISLLSKMLMKKTWATMR